MVLFHKTKLDSLNKLCGAARILRGLRIAARLGLSFSEETETAIHDLSSSILNLAKVTKEIRLADFMF